MKNSRWLLFIIVGVLVIGGASYLLWPGGETSPEELDVVEKTMLPTEIVEIATESVVVNETIDEEVIISTATQAIQPTPKTDLESTDPESVILASGDIQLIWLFAFW
jgi:hypothetical protein